MQLRPGRGVLQGFVDAAALRELVQAVVAMNLGARGKGKKAN
jgi:hypothetical protein